MSAGSKAGPNTKAGWPWASAPGPGDLSRRVAQRREELQLSVADLAARSGTSVEYLEQYPSQLTVEAMHKLAAALETTPAELLGGEAGLAPGRGGPALHPVLEELTTADCYELLAHGGVGRVGFSTPCGPLILPVNFALVQGLVVFRTATGGALAAHADGSDAGFEVDHVDEAMREGWSVLVNGPADRVTGQGELSWPPDQVPVWPWAGGEREEYVRITPAHVTGRRIRARSSGESQV